MVKYGKNVLVDFRTLVTDHKVRPIASIAGSKTGRTTKVILPFCLIVLANYLETPTSTLHSRSSPENQPQLQAHLPPPMRHDLKEEARHRRGDIQARFRRP